MEIVIRKATLNDAATAWDLRNTAILHHCPGFYSPDLLSSWTDGELTPQFAQAVADDFYVATIAEEVVGTGTICLTTGQIDAIFVRPDRMGHGVGKSIMAFLEEIAHGAELKKLKLNSTLNAAPFYRRCGFVGDAIGIYHSPRGFSLECVPMTKSLEPRSRLAVPK
jgi:GNAT superfamily N-acetyltransferase